MYVCDVMRYDVRDVSIAKNYDDTIWEYMIRECLREPRKNRPGAPRVCFEQ